MNASSTKRASASTQRAVGRICTRLDWSYRLLGGDERNLFRRFAVFAGGCSLEAFVAAAREQQRSAARLLAAVDVARAAIDQRRPADDELRVEEFLSQLRSSLDHAAFKTAWCAGKNMSLDEAIAFGRGLAPLPDLDFSPR